MHNIFPPAFFVTGTDTDVGKTFISAILVRGLRAGYWKPIGAGLPNTDTNWVRKYTALPEKCFFPPTYQFAAHVSPHLAAKLEGITIELGTVQLPDYKTLPHLIVEGAGGLMVPINKSQRIIDLIAHLNLPTLVIARSTLGTINHTTLTVDRLRQSAIPVMGVIMNGPKDLYNRQAIEHYAQVSVLAEIEPLAMVNADTLKATFHQCFGSINDNYVYNNQIADMAPVHANENRSGTATGGTR